MKVTKDDVKKAATEELEKYHKELLRIAGHTSVKKKSIVRALSLGLTAGLIDNDKRPMDYTEESLAKIVYSMTDCIFALRAIKLEEENELLTKQEEEKVNEKVQKTSKSRVRKSPEEGK